MTTTIRARLGRILAAALVTGFATQAAAQSYPEKPVRIIVPTVPGGGTDFTARTLAQQLTKSLGGSVVVENRGGANGNIGVEIAAQSPPDGYTLVMPITSFPVNPSLYSNLPFDTVNGFDSIALISKAPLVLVVNPSVPANTLQELIAYARANPGKLNFANSGPGTTSSIATELLKGRTGVEVGSVAYRGGGQIVTDLLAGHIHGYFSTVAASIQHIQAGTLRALAVTSTTRVHRLADVPTMVEAGVPDFEVVGWFGLFAPRGVPQPILQRLNKEVLSALETPEIRQVFDKEGLIVGGGTPADLHKLLVTDVERWGALIRKAGIRVN